MFRRTNRDFRDCGPLGSLQDRPSRLHDSKDGFKEEHRTASFRPQNRSPTGIDDLVGKPVHHLDLTDRTRKHESNLATEGFLVESHDLTECAKVGRATGRNACGKATSV